MRRIAKAIAATFILAMGICAQASSASAVDQQKKASCARLSTLYKRLESETLAAQRQVGALENASDFAGACKYGRTIGIPQFQRQLREQNAMRGEVCFPGIGDKTINFIQGVFEGYKREVEADCKKATTQNAQPSPKQPSSKTETTSGLCGSLVSGSTIAVGFHGGDVNKTERAKCISVENKCTYPISFRVQISGMNRPLQNEVSPGKVGKICASNESQSVSYLGMKKQ